MHCPQCGQPFSSEVRFCKSCGLSLESTIKLFSPGDSSPSQIEKWFERLRRSRGRRGVYRGMILIAVGIGLLAVTDGRDNIYSLILLGAGFLRIFYAMFFQEVVSTKAQRRAREDHIGPASPPKLQSANRTNALPSSQFVPAPNIGAAADTNEFVAVPSVTENTTSLLNESDS